MRRIGNIVISLLGVCLSPLVIIFWIIFPWVGVGISIYQWRRRVNLLKRAIPDSFCSIDADCPPDYVCSDGRCVPNSV
ncbi:MAG: hypothetical protein ACFFDI_18530 [Promethearchaeota archaeon]